MFITREFQFAAGRCAGSDEDGIVVLFKQSLEAFNARVEEAVDAHVENVAGLFVDHASGKAKRGDLAAHETASLAVRFIEVDLIAERHQVARDGQGGRSGTNQRYSFSVLFLWNLGQARLDIILKIGANALEAADGHGFIFDASAATGRFAGAVTGSAENAWKNIRFPVDHVGIRIAAGGDQADIFRHGSVRGAGKLAIDNFMEIFRVAHICRFHAFSPSFMLEVNSGDSVPQITGPSLACGI